jgi:hypothetical protein
MFIDYSKLKVDLPHYNKNTKKGRGCLKVG